MLGTVITAAVTLAQVPDRVPVPEALARTEIEVVLQTTLNHFCAENDSYSAQLLLFGSEELGAFASLPLGPGGRIVLPFPRGAADDLWVEVIAMDGPLWRNSGALSLSAVRDSSKRTLWVQAAHDRTVGWIAAEGEGVRHLVPESGLIGDALLAARPGLVDYRTATGRRHVPVPVPVKEKEGPPPVLDKEPLPPV